jgi:hypothetical protein
MKKPDITEVVSDLNNEAGKIRFTYYKTIFLACHKYRRPIGIHHTSKASICWQQIAADSCQPTHPKVAANRFQ